MKKLIIGVILLVVFIGIGILVQQGIIKWQPLTILFAAIIGPFKFIMDLFGSEEKIRQKHEAKRAEEHQFQTELETRIAQREDRVASLQKEIETLNATIANLKQEQDSIASKVSEMSTGEKQKLGKDLLGQ